MTGAGGRRWASRLKRNRTYPGRDHGRWRVQRPARSLDGISYSVDTEGRTANEDLRALVSYVDEIAEIPNSLRRGTQVRLDHATVRSRDRAVRPALSCCIRHGLLVIR